MSPLAAIWTAALVLSGGAIACMSALIVLRIFAARRERRRLADRRRLEAALVAVLQGRCDLQRELAPFCRRARLMAEALLDLLSVVRGHDREVVIRALESLGLPETLRGRLGRGSRAGRMVCLEALAAFPGAETEAALQAAAEHGSESMRLTALRSLYETRREMPLGRLLRELESGRLRASAVVGEFLRQLVAEAPASAAAELRQGLLPESVQVMLLDGLASAGDYGVLPTLIRLTQAPAAPVRAAAVRALGGLNHPGGEAAIRDALDDPEWTVRADAAQAAGDVRLAGLVEALGARLEDPVWRVRFLAAGALVKLGEPGRRRLAQAAAGSNPVTAETAALALVDARARA